jgi:hypothetical protein
MYDCVQNQWLPTGRPCTDICEEVHPYPICIDGYWWDCIDGAWVNTGFKCGVLPPPSDDTMLYIAIGGAAIAGLAGAALLLAKKGRKK